MQGGGVQANTVALHFRQYGNERHLQVFKERKQVLFLQLWKEEVVEPQRNVGVFAGIDTDFFRREVGHGLLLLSGTDEFCDGDGAVAQIGFGQIVHSVAHFGVQQVVGNHGVGHGAGQTDAVVAQHLQVVLYVLSHFQNVGTFVEGTELLHNAFVLYHGNVPGFSLLHGKTHANQPRVQRFGAGGFGVHAHGFCLHQHLHQRLPFLRRVGHSVGSLFRIVAEQSFRFLLFLGGKFNGRCAFRAEPFEKVTLDGHAVLFCGGRLGSEHLLRQCSELQIIKESFQAFLVRFLDGQRFHVQRYGHFRADGGEPFAQAYLLGVLRHLLL